MIFNQKTAQVKENLNIEKAVQKTFEVETPEDPYTLISKAVTADTTEQGKAGHIEQMYTDNKTGKFTAVVQIEGDGYYTYRVDTDTKVTILQ